MKYLLRCLLLSGLLVLIVSLVSAQAACADIVSQALTQLDHACSRMGGRDRVCYGNPTVVAQPNPGITDLHFATPGDIENIGRIQSLTLSGMNPDTGEWGVAKIQFLTGVSGVLLEQDVTFLLFGDAQITRDIATARDSGYGSGMQAFTFSSGVGDALCSEAPDSGILIQTGRDGATAAFRFNGVQVWFGATIYIESSPGGSMYIYTLNGKATVSAFGVSKIVPAGTRVSIPVDENSRAVAPASDPESYDTGVVRRLASLMSHMPRPIGIAPALDLTVCTLIPMGKVITYRGPGNRFQPVFAVGPIPLQPTGIAADSTGAHWYRLDMGSWVLKNVVHAFGPCDTLPVIEPPPGATDNPAVLRWTVVETITRNTCHVTNPPVGEIRISNPELSFNEDRSILTWAWNATENMLLERVADNVYTGISDGFLTMTVTFLSPTSLTVTYSFAPACILSYDAVGVATD